MRFLNLDRIIFLKMDHWSIFNTAVQVEDIDSACKLFEDIMTREGLQVLYCEKLARLGLKFTVLLIKVHYSLNFLYVNNLGYIYTVSGQRHIT